RCPRNCVLVEIGVVVLDQLARALLAVRRRYDAQIGIEAEPYLLRRSRWRLHNDRKYGVSVCLHKVGQHDLALVAVPVLRDYCPNSSITPLITARSLQNR